MGVRVDWPEMTSGLRETSYSAAISSVVTTPDLQHTHTHTHTHTNRIRRRNRGVVREIRLEVKWKWMYLHDCSSARTMKLEYVIRVVWTLDYTLLQMQPIPPLPTPSYLIPFHTIPSHSIPSHYISVHPIPTYPIPSHDMTSHSNLSQPMTYLSVSRRSKARHTRAVLLEFMSPFMATKNSVTSMKPLRSRSIRHNGEW